MVVVHPLQPAPVAHTIEQGVTAGAVGVTALNAVTYLDMAIRARPSSSTPQETVEVSAHKVGIHIPGDGERRDNRLQGLGPLAGIATGLAAGVAAATVRRWRPAMGFPATAFLAGATAMAAADAPMAVLGVTDPRNGPSRTGSRTLCRTPVTGSLLPPSSG